MQKWQMMLTGAPEAGKSTLCKALLGHDRDVLKTQAPEYHGKVIMDLPGEYMVHPHLRRNLLSFLQDVRLVVFVHAANATSLGIPHGLLQILPGVDVLGVISKVDLPDADVEQSRALLQQMGIAEPYYEVSSFSEATVAPLRQRLRDMGVLPDAEPEHGAA